MYNNYLKLLSLNHNCHEKKKKDDFVTFLSNLLNISDTSPCSTCRPVEMKKGLGGRDLIKKYWKNWLATKKIVHLKMFKVPRNT